MHLVCPCHLVGLLVRHLPTAQTPLTQLVTQLPQPILSLLSTVNGKTYLSSQLLVSPFLLFPTLKSIYRDDDAGLQENTFCQSVVLSPSVKSCAKLTIFSSLFGAAWCSSPNCQHHWAPGVGIMLTQSREIFKTRCCSHISASFIRSQLNRPAHK